MDTLKRSAIDFIAEKAPLIAHVADEIWGYAELSLQEERSARLYCDVLRAEGFAVEENVCGISTAFTASYGAGKPVIGILAEYDALSGLSQVGKLSGGNVQKVLVGREIASAPTVLMVAYPVRGLDINSAYTIYSLLNVQKMRGVAVLCVGEDLDVLLALCDRILVLCGGRVTGIVDARTATKEQIGLMMTQSGKGGER